MDREAFSAGSVVTEMEDIICLNIDAESDSGEILAKQFGVRGYPTLLFLNSDASPRDVIGGYLPTDSFLATVKRIKSGAGSVSDLREQVEAEPDNLEPMFALLAKLEKFNAQADIKALRESLAAKIKAGKGYDPNSIDSRWTLFQNLQRAGLGKLADEQAAGMARLDPDGKSLPLRRIQVEQLLKGLERPEDLGPLKLFLANETYNEVLYQGHHAIFTITDRASKRVKGNEPKRLALRAETRQAAIRLWKHTPPKYHGRVGNAIAWGFYEDAKQLNDKERAFALLVAESAVGAQGDNPNVIDTYACCLFINGKVDEALKQVDRCIELDPNNEEWLKRRALFVKSRG